MHIVNCPSLRGDNLLENLCLIGSRGKIMTTVNLKKN